MSVLTKEECAVRRKLAALYGTEVSELIDSHEELRAELEETDELNKRLSAILHATANALKGQPEPLHVHSWHDLAEVAQKQRERIVKLEQALADNVPYAALQRGACGCASKDCKIEQAIRLLREGR